MEQFGLTIWLNTKDIQNAFSSLDRRLIFQFDSVLQKLFRIHSLTLPLGKVFEKYLLFSIYSVMKVLKPSYLQLDKLNKTRNT